MSIQSPPARVTRRDFIKVSAGASFGLLSISMKSLPMGSAYAVWTGIGAVGAFLVGVLVLGEALTAGRALAAGLIVSGLVLMQVTSQG